MMEEDRTLRLDLLVCDLMRRYAQSGRSLAFSFWYSVYGPLAEALVKKFLAPVDPSGFGIGGEKVQNRKGRRIVR